MGEFFDSSDHVEAEGVVVAAVVHRDHVGGSNFVDKVRGLGRVDRVVTAYGDHGNVQIFQLCELICGKLAAEVAKVGDPLTIGTENEDCIAAAQNAFERVVKSLDLRNGERRLASVWSPCSWLHRTSSAVSLTGPSPGT